MDQKQVDSTITKLDLSDITLDPEIQPRQQLNQEVITEYAGAMSHGAEFPPVVVFFDSKQYWLSDGFHRVQATELIGERNILAEVRSGSYRDAVLYAVGSDTTLRLRRTNADKKIIVERLLQDSEWGKWSNCEIARRCGVSNEMVRVTRKKLSSNDWTIQKLTNNLPKSTQRIVRRNGKTYAMNISNMNSREKSTSSP